MHRQSGRYGEYWQKVAECYPKHYNEAAEPDLGIDE